MDIRVLTLWQPWATLFAYDVKKFETRPSPTRHTGQYLIHAAARPISGEIREKCEHPDFLEILQKIGFSSWQDLPFGAIVGMYDHGGWPATIAKLSDMAGFERAAKIDEDEIRHRRLKFGLNWD